jgi:hypothetical protein
MQKAIQLVFLKATGSKQNRPRGAAQKMISFFCRLLCLVGDLLLKNPI